MATANVGKVMRLIELTGQMLEELHRDELDAGATARVRSAYHESLHQLRSVLPEDSWQELDHLLDPAGDAASGRLGSNAGLRINEAQLLGWLEGLLNGIEADHAVRQVQAESDAADEVRQARGSGRRSQPARQGTTAGYR